GNQAAAWTWTDTTGSFWGRNKLGQKWVEATHAVLANKSDPFFGLRDYFYTAGQRISMLHFALPVAPEYKLLLAGAIFKSLAKPQVPQMPNYHTFVDLFSLLTESDGALETPLQKTNQARNKQSERPMTQGDVIDTLLGYVLHEAEDPLQYGNIRPVIVTMALARHYGPHAKQLDAFFVEHGEWLEDLFDFDLSALEFPTGQDVNLKTRHLVATLGRVGIDISSQVNGISPVIEDSAPFKNRQYIVDELDAALYRQLTTRSEQGFSQDDLHRQFEEIEDAFDQQRHEEAKKKVRTLVAVQGNSPHQQEIRAFLETHKWIERELKIDIDDPRWPSLRKHRDRALRIKKEVSISLTEYEPNLRYDATRRVPFWKSAMAFVFGRRSKKQTEAGTETTRFSEGLFVTP
ncbi:MAG TPA: hypothetical protein VJC18_04485, partial [bacterium]|nr:hypothetical protein [bacterium]